METMETEPIARRVDLSKEFLEKQAAEIKTRINKYQDRNRIKEELRQGDVSGYIMHKQTNVVPQLEKALERLHKGIYGICSKCQAPIEKERLELVPGADICINCIKEKPKRIF